MWATASTRVVEETSISLAAEGAARESRRDEEGADAPEDRHRHRIGITRWTRSILGMLGGALAAVAREAAQRRV